MTHLHHHLAKGQVSVEILYAMGVMLVIFLILNGVAFNRRLELQRNSDYFFKRDSCMKVANALIGGFSSGDGAQIQFESKYNTTIFSVGLILVSDDVKTDRTIEATCTFSANMTKSSYNIKGTLYKVINEQNTLGIKQWSQSLGTWVDV